MRALCRRPPSAAAASALAPSQSTQPPTQRLGEQEEIKQQAENEQLDANANLPAHGEVPTAPQASLANQPTSVPANEAAAGQQLPVGGSADQEAAAETSQMRMPAAKARQSSKQQASACEKARGNGEVMASHGCEKVDANGDLKPAAQSATAEQPMEVDSDPIGATAGQQPFKGHESAPALLAAATGNSAANKTARGSPAGSPGSSRKPNASDGMHPSQADCTASELDGGQAPSADDRPGVVTGEPDFSATPADASAEPNARMHASAIEGHATETEVGHETAARAAVGAETAAEALIEAQRRSVMDVLVDARWLAAAALPHRPLSLAADSPLALLAAQASLAKQPDVQVLLSLKNFSVDGKSS